MLFAVIYRPRKTVTEESERRNMLEFASWTPPAGLQIKEHYHGPGLVGIVLCEVDSAATLVEYIAPFIPYFEHEFFPVMPVEDAVPILKKVYDWQASIK
jgi:Domain of unknown function (DUF3303)